MSQPYQFPSWFLKYEIFLIYRTKKLNKMTANMETSSTKLSSPPTAGLPVAILVCLTAFTKVLSPHSPTAISYLDSTTALGEIQMKGWSRPERSTPLPWHKTPPHQSSLVPSCIKQSCTPLTPRRDPRTVVPALCLRFKGRRDGSEGSIHLGSSTPHVMSIYVIYCLRKGEHFLWPPRQQKQDCDSDSKNCFLRDFEK